MKPLEEKTFAQIAIVLLVISLCINVCLSIEVERLSAANEALLIRRNLAEVLPQKAMEELVTGTPPTLGSADSSVSLVIFSDFQCPFCKRFSQALHALSPEQKSSIRLVFRHFPLPIHRYAFREALTAACGAREDDSVFWHFYESSDMQDLQLDQTESMIKAFKTSPKFNQKHFDACIESGKGKRIVQEDLALGAKYGVRGTPTMFLNGKRLVGDQQPISDLVQSAMVRR